MYYKTIAVKTKKRVFYGTGIDLRRIAVVTVGYGIVGSFSDHQNAEFYSAALGLGLSVFDEIRHDKYGSKQMDLRWPALGLLVGGFLGSYFNIHTKYFVGKLTDIGAGIGGLLGFYNTIREIMPRSK